MKSKHFLLFVAAFSLVAVSSANAQLGVGMFKRPNIANIFHPVVGGGAAYERTDHDGKTSTMEMSIVGSEMVGTKQGSWTPHRPTAKPWKKVSTSGTPLAPNPSPFLPALFPANIGPRTTAKAASGSAPESPR